MAQVTLYSAVLGAAIIQVCGAGILVGAKEAFLLPTEWQNQIGPSDSQALEGFACRFVLANGVVVAAHVADAVGIDFRLPDKATGGFLAVSLLVIHPPVGGRRLWGW